MDHPDTNTIAECLQGGGVVLIPTDTVYGLAVHPEHPEAINRLYELKGRPPRVNLPIMVADKSDLAALGVDCNASIIKLLNSIYVPGPLTLAVGFTTHPTVAWLDGRVEIAVRIPNDERLLNVLRNTGPLLVTSANLHRMPSGETIAEILGQLNGRPDLVVDGGTLRTVPSSLINCRLTPPVIERTGLISDKELLAILND
jgi:L-threonylcarbamoyladenylate synthase